jgi:ABC-type multidrug transport system fused ATPase/permease subunit
MLAAGVFYSRVVRPRFRVRQRVVGELSGVLQDNLTGMKEIQAFNQQARESGRVGYLARKHTTTVLGALKLGALYHPAVTLFSYLGTVFVIIYGGAMAEKDPAVIADIVAFIMYLRVFYEPVAAMARVNEDIQAAIAGAERVFEALDENPDVAEKDGATELLNPKGDILFENVSFHYDDDKPVLSNINVRIKAGEIVALVGPTGVGKTTLTSLINRFYDPTEGNIFIDGVNIRDVTLKSLRDSISVVLQDVFLFNGTIAENIAYGAENASPRQIAAAAETARAHDFIMDMPNGYGSVVGERGVRLSGGQRQRISIARAVLRDKPILILDEATASVDVETEKLIHDAMDEIMKGRTTILIAHRLSTVKKAGRVIVLNNGVIEETGNHEELKRMNGLYSKFVNIQYSQTT